MKRLLDETTDDFTRALLVAGIEQRPPAGNQRKLLLALGAGSALGLFSSQALAWLGTSGGKLSLLGVALGVAGAVYAVGPWSEAEPGEGGAPHGAWSTSGPAPAPLSPAAPAAPSAAAPATGSVLLPEPSLPGDGSPALVPKSEVGTELAVRARPQQAGSKRGRVSSASSTPPREASIEPQPASPAADALVQAEARLQSASLDAEVRLVDDMRGAARRKDDEALARLVATYQASFPDGQLAQEVSAFAARLERLKKPEP